MNMIAVAVCMACIMEGCSTEYAVVADRLRNGNSLTYEQLNAAVNEPVIGNTQILLADGRIFDLASIDVRNDSTHFIDGQEVHRCVPTNGISVIRRTDHWGGLLLGFCTGVLVGGGAGGALALITPSGGHPDLGKAYAILGGLAIGGTVGAVVGTIDGHRDEYKFLPDSTRTIP